MEEYDLTFPIVNKDELVHKLDNISRLINDHKNKKKVANQVDFSATYAVLVTYIKVPTYGTYYEGVSFLYTYSYIIIYYSKNTSHYILPRNETYKMYSVVQYVFAEDIYPSDFYVNYLPIFLRVCC